MTHHNHLRQYDPPFIVVRDVAGIATIDGRDCTVHPFKKARLCVYLCARSTRHLSGRIARAKKALSAHHPLLHQQGDTDAVVTFDDNLAALKSLSKVFSLRKRRPTQKLRGAALTAKQRKEDNS